MLGHLRLRRALGPALALLLLLLLLPAARAQETVIVTTIVATAAPAYPTDNPSYVDDATFRRDVLNSTNFFRGQHGAVSLDWNDTLAEFGSDYVERCEWAHSGGPYGENLGQGYPDVAAAIDAWGLERRLYDFAAGDFDEHTGHFTQLVWRATRAVGCGRRFCNGENDVAGWYIVCEYAPRGNILGAFQANVRPQGDGSTPPPSASSTDAPSATPTSEAWSLFGSLRVLDMQVSWVAAMVVVLFNI